MNRPIILALPIATLLLAGCASKHEVAAASSTGPKTVTVTAAQAVTRTVPASFQETGTFIGKPAPAFVLAQLQDPAKTLGPTDLKGQVWLLNVWASWCVSCRDEHT